MVKQVQRQLMESGFRFVEKQGGLWVEAAPNRSHRKIVQALREGAPVLRSSKAASPRVEHSHGSSPAGGIRNPPEEHGREDWILQKGLSGGENVKNQKEGLVVSADAGILCDQGNEVGCDMTDDYVEIFLDLFGLLEIEK